jgi:hypothetical protein
MPGRTQPTRHGLMNRVLGAQDQGKNAGLQQEMLIVDSRWVGALNVPGSCPPPTGDPDQSYAVTKIGNQAGFVMPGQPTLTNAVSSGSSYTLLQVTPLGGPVYDGQVVVLVSGGSGGLVQAWTVSSGGAAAGATNIPVVSQTATENFPIGTIVSGAAAAVPGPGISMWRQGQVLTSQLTAGSTYTSLSCTAFLPGVSGVAQAGAQITTIQPGALPAVSQTWTLYSPANGGDMTLQVTSQPLPAGQTAQVAEATFSIGSLIGIWLPL